MHSTKILAICIGVLAQLTVAVNLFVSSYDGNVTTLSLEGTNTTYTLKSTSQSRDCGKDPSWMVYDKPNRLLYCLDENRPADGQPPPPETVFVSYNVDAKTGALTVTKAGKLKTSMSVSGALFGNNKYMAVAGYTGQVSVLSLEQGSFTQIQVLNYPDKNGLTANTTATSPHQVVVDPTGEFVLVPDKGGDLIHVYTGSDNAKDGKVFVEQEPLWMNAGTGPRHITFWQDNTSYANDTYLFVLAEVANTITSYKVTYTDEAMSFRQVESQNTFGGVSTPEGVAAAEIQVSPDNRFVIVSNRGDSTFEIGGSRAAGGAVKEATHSLATYEIGAGGKLFFRQIWPAGGLVPRQFTINKAGDKIAVGLQNSCRVVVLRRDVKSGEIGKPLASIALGNCVGVANGLTVVIWDE